MKNINEFINNQIVDKKSVAIFGGVATTNGGYITDSYTDNDNSGTLSTGDTICFLEEPIPMVNT